MQKSDAPETQQNSTIFKSDLKQKRDEYNVDIRKQKRDEHLRKLRNSNFEIENKIISSGFSTLGGAFDNAENAELRKSISEWLKRQYKMEEFLDLVKTVNSNDRFKQHYGVIGLRKLLSQDSSLPIQHTIDNNLVPQLISFLKNDKEPHLQLEASWVLTNLVSGTTKQTQVIIESEGIPCFINLLKSPKIDLVEQGILALGNIATDCHQFRDIALRSGALEVLAQVIRNTNTPSVIKHGLWALSCLCRSRPLPNFEMVNKAIPIFVKGLQQTNDPEIVTDSAWALSYLTTGESHQIQYTVETGAIPILGALLATDRLSVIVPVIRILGNISTGSEEQINMLIEDANVISNLYKLTEHSKKIVKSEVCWALSNIAAGNERHVQAVIGNIAYLNKLISLTMSNNIELKREAIYVLSNATKECNLDQTVKMAQYGVMRCFCETLQCSEDPKTLELVLIGLNNLISKGNLLAQQLNGNNPFLQELEQNDGLDRIQQLQKHKNDAVYQAALKLLENHYDLEDDT